MCTTLIFENKEIDNVNDLLLNTTIHANDLILDSNYKKLDMDSCLCQLNLDQTLKNFKIEKDIFFWYIK